MDGRSRPGHPCAGYRAGGLLPAHRRPRQSPSRAAPASRTSIQQHFPPPALVPWPLPLARLRPAERFKPVLQPDIRTMPAAVRHHAGQAALWMVDTASASPPVGCDFSVTFHAKPSHFATDPLRTPLSRQTSRPGREGGSERHHPRRRHDGITPGAIAEGMRCLLPHPLPSSRRTSGPMVTASCRSRNACHPRHCHP